MQPVNGYRVQQQITPPQQRSYGSSEIVSSAVRTPQHTNTTILPEDVVTLSNDRSSALSLKKEPSSPVTTAESKALREVFSVYA